jgi:hypothetical protein
MSRELKTEVEIHHARIFELSELIKQHEYLTPEGLTEWTDRPAVDSLFSDITRESERHVAAIRELGVCEDVKVNYRGFEIRIHDCRADRDFDDSALHFSATIWSPPRLGLPEERFKSAEEAEAAKQSKVRFFSSIEEATEEARHNIDDSIAGDAWRE